MGVGDGVLGLSSVINRSSPTQVGTLTDWNFLAGYNIAFATKSDGTLWVWGSGDGGQLGLNLGGSIGRSSPVQVGSSRDWVTVAASGVHTLATKTDGTLWAWGGGYNPGDAPSLGLNSLIERSSPTQVGTLNTWTAVSAGHGLGGQDHSLALKTDGTLWAWGVGSALGLNSGVIRSSPAQVGSMTDWQQIVASSNGGGSTSSAAIKITGTLWTWGGGGATLGLNNTADVSSPTQVGTLTNWKSVSMGRLHAVAAKTDGTIWIWGTGTDGRLGLNSTTARSSPTQVGTLTDWSQAAAGDGVTVAIKNDGTLWTWGIGTSGQMGSNAALSRSSPVQVGTSKSWKSIFLRSDNVFAREFN